LSADLTARAATAPTRAPRLLVLAIVPLIAFMALAHTTIEGDSASTMTPAQLDDRAAMWIIVAILWVLPVVLAGIAFATLASELDPGSSLRPLAGVGIALLACHVVAQAAVVAFDDSRTLADSTTYAVAILLSLLGWWVIDVVAALTCLRLYRSRGAARKTSGVVGVLTALFLLLEIAVYLPALVGSQELHDTIGLPPMLLPLLWAVLGGVLWRSGRRC
jgi:hypothetical protein